MGMTRVDSTQTELCHGQSKTKQEELSHQESESTFRQIAESIFDLVCAVDTEASYRYLNPSYKRVLGYDPHDLRGESLFARIHPDDQAGVKAEYEEAVRTRSNRATEFRYQHTNGNYVWLRSAWSLQFDATGVCVEVIICSHDITEHKEAQAALAESEQRFRTLSGATFEGIAYIHDGVFIDVNEQFADMIGYERDELIGMSVLEPPLPEYRARIGDAIREDRREPYEVVSVSKQGKKVALEIRGRARVIGDKQVRVTAVRNVTERKAAEEALRTSEERLRFALEGTTDGIWDWDLKTDKVFFSPRWYTMLGYEPDELPGSYETWVQLLHPDDAESAEAAVKRAVEQQVPFAIEFRLKAKNGKWIWILSRGKVVQFDAEGSPVRVAGSHVDISDRKRMEEALEKRILSLTQPPDAVEKVAFEDLFDLSEIQHLQDLYADAFGVAALMTRPDGTPITQPSNFCELCAEIIRKTPKGAENCRYSDSMIGRYNPTGPNIQPCLSVGLCNAGASITVGGRHVGNWLIGQVRNEAQDGEKIVEYAREIGADEAKFRAAYRKVPVMSEEQFNRAAEVLFVVANQISTAAYRNLQQARFIAQLKRAEEEILELNESLERRVHERTAELEAATKELEAFSYSVSHDLRAPLRAIHGYSRILEEDYHSCLGEDGRRSLAIVTSEASRMGRLIDDLLGFFRLNKKPLTKMETDMTALVREVFDELCLDVPNRKVEFRLERLPVARADPSLVRQVWANLLGNALKFTSGRELSEITVSGSTQGKEVIYSVKDNGVGFDVRYAEKIFGVFQRLHREDEFEGTGVGLALVQRIVHRHGGHIWSEAEVDRGATFHFTLPQ